ncbi:hypothetical protein PGB90_007504 [Kerria lacca]
MNSKSINQSYINNSIAIGQEIQRFESVHPSIYAIYDLIELIPDAIVAQQIRDHVVCIEDLFKKEGYVSNSLNSFHSRIMSYSQLCFEVAIIFANDYYLGDTLSVRAKHQ